MYFTQYQCGSTINFLRSGSILWATVYSMPRVLHFPPSDWRKSQRLLQFFLVAFRFYFNSINQERNADLPAPTGHRHAAGGRVRFVTSVTGENRTNHIRHRPIIRFPLSDSVVSQANTRVSIRYPFESPALYREMHSPVRCVHPMSPAERIIRSYRTQKVFHRSSYGLSIDIKLNTIYSNITEIF